MVEFRSENMIIPYQTAVDFMKNRVNLISEENADEMIWLLEHDDLITKGLNAKDEELLDFRFPVYETNRGGKFTYHGKGQRIVYCMINLKKRNLSVEKFVNALENWIICSLSEMGIKANNSSLGHGIFINDKKIAALGLRIRKNISYHGIALNVNPNLDNFKSIIPCGIKDAKVTSLKEQGCNLSFEDIDNILKKCFNLYELNLE